MKNINLWLTDSWKILLIISLLLPTLTWASSPNEHEVSCVEAILTTLFAGSQEDRIAMAVGTGKWVNDLGQFDF